MKKFIVGGNFKCNGSLNSINEIIKKVIDFGGLEFSINKMNFFKEKALKILHSFPKNKYRDSLQLLLNYIIERKI